MAATYAVSKIENLERRVWGTYQKNCAARGIRFELSREVFSYLIQQVCHYCARPPRNKDKRRNFIFFYQGIDRKDNTIGYVEDNCVPCCFECNSIKGNKLSHDELIVVAFALREFRLRRAR